MQNVVNLVNVQLCTAQCSLLQSPAYRFSDSRRLLYFGRIISFFQPHIFTARRNARIASAVLYSNSVRLCLSHGAGRRYCVKTTVTVIPPLYQLILVAAAGHFLLQNIKAQPFKKTLLVVSY